MGKLTEWVKLNVREGANIAEFEELEGRNTFEGMETKEQAMELIKSNPVALKALDAETSARVTAHDTKFQAEKLPALKEELTAAIKAELNPPKTEAEKQLAEQSKIITEMKSKETKRELEGLLRAEAKKIGYPEDQAARFAIYGETAVQVMTSEAEMLKTAISTGTEAQIKELYGDQKPPEKQKTPENAIGRSEFEKLPPTAQTEFIRKGGAVTD